MLNGIILYYSLGRRIPFWFGVLKVNSVKTDDDGETTDFEVNDNENNFEKQLVSTRLVVARVTTVVPVSATVSVFATVSVSVMVSVSAMV